MELEERLEGNKLISKFACIKHDDGTIVSHLAGGYPKGTMHCVLNRCPINTLYPFDYKYVYINNGRWDTAWDWLMPVVELIRKTAGACTDSDSDEKKSAFLLFSLGITTPIETVYMYVVNYIKWYNTQR